jgi:hypothetical protein
MDFKEFTGDLSFDRYGGNRLNIADGSNFHGHGFLRNPGHHDRYTR